MKTARQTFPAHNISQHPVFLLGAPAGKTSREPARQEAEPARTRTCTLPTASRPAQPAFSSSGASRGRAGPAEGCAVHPLGGGVALHQLWRLTGCRPHRPFPVLIRRLPLCLGYTIQAKLSLVLNLGTELIFLFLPEIVSTFASPVRLSGRGDEPMPSALPASGPFHASSQAQWSSQVSPRLSPAHCTLAALPVQDTLPSRPRKACTSAVKPSWPLRACCARDPLGASRPQQWPLDVSTGHI